MFNLYHSNQLDILKTLVVELIRREPLPDPFAEEVILVQSPGMAQWLRLELAEAFGIAANIRFPLPASFIWEMFTQVLPDIPQRSAFNKPAMGWKLMGLLPGMLDEEAFAPLRQYLRDDGDQRKNYQLCHQVADIFDQYLVYRPEWMLDWEQGGQVAAEGQPWQPPLWRALTRLTAELGQPGAHRANLYQDFIETLERGKDFPTLPRRIFVFGISALPPRYLDALKAMSQHVEIHLMLTNPCRHYWGDIVDQGYLAKLQARARRTLRPGSDMLQGSETRPLVEASDQPEQLFDSQGEFIVGNPLLASMGKLGRDNVSLLTERELNEIEVFVAPEADTLLAQVQRDILELSDPTVPDHAGYALDAKDRSLGIQLCHSPMRELEVLHDHLLALFEQDPTLKPRDIIVMMPDVNTYSPAIQAVFGSAPGDRAIPFAISDRSQKQENPILLSFLQLLALPTARCSVAELVEILEVPAIMARFNLGSNDLEQLRQWSTDAGVRWGLSADDGERFDLPQLPVNTWSFGLNRMLLGYASGYPALFDNILPYPEIEGMEGALLGQLAAFIEQIEHFRDALPQPRTIEQWQQTVNDLLAAFYQVDSDGEQVLQLIRQQMQQLVEQLDDARFEQPLTLEVLSDHLNQSLTGERASQRFLAGQVNFCTLMPMRSIPFRVICLLGMNDSAYPRAIPPLGFDLMAQHPPKRGDRSRRDDDRYLFLEALLSAQQSLYISFVGRSIRDNSEKVPSVLVNELLDYCQQAFHLAGTESLDQDKRQQAVVDHLVTEHPLQPFSRDNFTPTAPGSFAAEWLPRASDAQSEPAFISAALPAAEKESELELSEVQRFYRQPCRYFLNRRLRIHFERDELERQEDEPFNLDALEAFQLRDTLLEGWLKGDDMAGLHQRLLASGQLPQGAFGQQMLAETSAECQQLAERIRPRLRYPQPDAEVNLLLPSGQRLTGWLKGCFDGALVRYKPGTLNSADFLRHWLDHLCACLVMDKPRPTQLLDRKQHWLLHPLEKEVAHTRLLQLLDHFEQGLNQPSALLPRTAWTWLAHSCQAVEGGWQPSSDGTVLQKALGKAEEAFMGTYLYPGEGADPYVFRCFPAWEENLVSKLQQYAHDLLLPLKNALVEAEQ